MSDNSFEGKSPYKIGDTVVYHHDGICVVKDIRTENFASSGEKLYYVLEPAFAKNDTEIYVPVSKAINGHMRNLLSKKEIDSIITKSEKFDKEWVSDSKERNDEYMSILESGDRAKILWLIKMLSVHKLEVEKENRKFYVSDQRILETAQKSLMEEFAFVLGIKKKDVIDYIMEKIKMISPELEKQQGE